MINDSGHQVSSDRGGVQGHNVYDHLVTRNCCKLFNIVLSLLWGQCQNVIKIFDAFVAEVWGLSGRFFVSVSKFVFFSIFAVDHWWCMTSQLSSAIISTIWCCLMFAGQESRPGLPTPAQHRVERRSAFKQICWELCRNCELMLVRYWHCLVSCSHVNYDTIYWSLAAPPTMIQW